MVVKETEKGSLEEKAYSVERENIEDPLLKSKVEGLVRHYNSDQDMRDSYIEDIRLIEAGDHYVVEVELKDGEVLDETDNSRKLKYLTDGVYPSFRMSHVLGGFQAGSGNGGIEDLLSAEFEGYEIGKDHAYFCNPTSPFFGNPDANLFIFGKEAFIEQLNSLTKEYFGKSAEKYMKENVREFIDDPFNGIGKKDYHYYDTGCHDGEALLFEGLGFPLNNYTSYSLVGAKKALEGELHGKKSQNLFDKLFPFVEGKKMSPKDIVGFANLAFHSAPNYIKVVRNKTEYLNYLATVSGGESSAHEDIKGEDWFEGIYDVEDLSRFDDEGVVYEELEWGHSPGPCYDDYGLHMIVNSDDKKAELGDAELIVSKGCLLESDGEIGRPRVLHVVKKDRFQ